MEHPAGQGAPEALAPQPLPPNARDAWPGFLRTMGWIGLNTFGGPVAQIGVMHQVAVERRRWLTDGEFVHLLNFANVIPGPEALELAIHLGYLRRGVLGGIAAGLLFLWPGFVSLTLLAWIYERFGGLAGVTAALDGIRPVALALVAAAAIRLSRRSLQGGVSYVLMAAAFVASFVLGVPFLLILLGCGALGFALRRHRREPAKGGDARLGWLFALLVVGVVGGSQLWARHGASPGATEAGVPTQTVEASTSPERLRDVAWLNTKAALVTFGGAYTVLPYLREQSVQHYRWLEDREMVDALALGETTPGPLISIGIFISYLAAGFPGAVVGCVFLFLPAFVIVLTLGRHIERVERLPHARAILWGFSAGTLGLVLALAATMVNPSIPDAFAAVLAGAAFLAVWRLEANLIVVVVVGALLGLARRAIS